MVWLLYIGLLLLVVIFFISYSTIPKKKSARYYFEDYLSSLNDLEQEFWLLLSLYRDAGIKVDKLACNVAYSHSHYMATEKKVSHDYFEDRSLLLQEQGAQSLGEIVGAFSELKTVFKKFKQSENHNNTMLNNNYNCCGISIVLTGSVYFITVIFIKI